METIKLQVTGQSIEVLSGPDWLVAGSQELYRAEFALDASWNAYPTKMAVFRGRRVERETPIINGVATVPWEALIAHSSLEVGVYGIDGDTTCPTIWCRYPTLTRPGATPTDPAAPTPPGWQAALGSKADGLTVDDNTLFLTSDGKIISEGVDLPMDGNGIPAPESASVGQLIRVSAIDEDGKVAAVEAVDVADAIRLQAKTVAPANEARTVTPDVGFDGLSSVTVSAAETLVLAENERIYQIATGTVVVDTEILRFEIGNEVG